MALRAYSEIVTALNSVNISFADHPFRIYPVNPCLRKQCLFVLAKGMPSHEEIA